MTIKLKPCPFCGGEAIISAYHNTEMKRMKYYATCCNEKCSINPAGKAKDTIKEAVNDWNTREEKTK